jgi:ribonuclease P/MRP protein subunit RPP40
MEVYEYLSLLILPYGPADRIKAADSVDTYLSTYTVDDAHSDSITQIRLSGLVPARWVNELWGNLENLLEELPEDKAKMAWAGMVVHGFDDVPVRPTGNQKGSLERCGTSYTMLKLPEKGGVMVWDIAGGQSE